jgi:hypothetical protein
VAASTGANEAPMVPPTENTLIAFCDAPPAARAATVAGGW